MRRILAFTLTLLFGWVLVLSAFARTSGSSIPACCRKDGKHHCALTDSSHSPETAFAAPVRCPYSAMGMTVVHVDPLTPAASAAIYAGLLSHPALFAQVEAAHRFTSIRVRQKRGPPSFLQS